MLWSSLVLSLMTVANFITYTIAFAVVDYPLEPRLQFSSAWIQFTVIYLLLRSIVARILYFVPYGLY